MLLEMARRGHVRGAQRVGVWCTYGSQQREVRTGQMQAIPTSGNLPQARSIAGMMRQK